MKTISLFTPFESFTGTLHLRAFTEMFCLDLAKLCGWNSIVLAFASSTKDFDDGVTGMVFFLSLILLIVKRRAS